MVATACPRCDSVVALHEGRPVVTHDGVQLWHAVCYDRRDIPLVRAPDGFAPLRYPPAPAPRVHPAQLALGGMVGAVAVTCAVAQVMWASRVAIDDDALPNLEDRIEVTVATHAVVTANETRPRASIRLASDMAARYPLPVVDGTPLDERYPSLASWIHPVSASLELVSTSPPERLFGTERKGVKRRRECGRGHCGIDLDGPRGRPIVAVADAIVIKIERREMGGDGISGRFVKLRHDDGVFTSYMHLDDVSSQLVVKQRIAAGTYLGTLGATATFSAPPHLHLAVEIPNRDDHTGDHTNTHYVDPAPFLARSTIVPVPDKRARDPIKAF